jgi:hypothetical protein
MIEGDPLRETEHLGDEATWHGRCSSACSRMEPKIPTPRAPHLLRLANGSASVPTVAPLVPRQRGLSFTDIPTALVDLSPTMLHRIRALAPKRRFSWIPCVIAGGFLAVVAALCVDPSVRDFALAELSAPPPAHVASAAPPPPEEKPRVVLAAPIVMTNDPIDAPAVTVSPPVPAMPPAKSKKGAFPAAPKPQRGVARPAAVRARNMLAARVPDRGF